MILPNQINDQEFTFVKGMYKAQEVDEFLNEVAESYDKTFRENGELIKKLEILADKVEEYRNDEDNIRMALLAAQRAADQLTKEAEAKAEKTVKEANETASFTEAEAKANAEKILSDAKAESEKLVANAQSEAERILEDAKDFATKAEADYQRNKKIEEVALEALKNETAKFKAEILSMYNAHIALINQLPGLIETEEEALPEGIETVSSYSEESYEDDSASGSEETAEETVEETVEKTVEETVESSGETKIAEEETTDANLSDFEEQQTLDHVFDDDVDKTDISAELPNVNYDPIDEETQNDKESVSSENGDYVPQVGRKQSFEEAFAAFFNDDEDDEEDFSELDELEDEFSDDSDFDDDDFSMFGSEDTEDGDDSAKGGFSRFFKKK